MIALYGSRLGTVKIKLEFAGVVKYMTLGPGQTKTKETLTHKIRPSKHDKLYMTIIEIDPTIEWISAMLWGEQDFPGYPLIKV